ncbi:MAG: hypothetical protein KatS3mg115_2245 [Candidatus Poribacteria bacterium]|nr:MAG: hypothetical protein KatS3mg115_2245 [Candidatus Poribacteria bacterium]
MLRRWGISVGLALAALLGTATAQIYLQDDFSGDDSNWVPLWGDWVVEDGVYKQRSLEINTMSVVADEAWDDSWVEYTFECRARRVEGPEGFLVMFRLNGMMQDRGVALAPHPPRMASAPRSTQYWWNLGGWANTRSGVERWIDSARVEQGFQEGHSLELNRWYEIKIENRTDGYALYLDGQLFAEVQDAEVQGGRVGLGSWATAVEYDDVLVYGPAGPIATAVSPRDKLATTWASLKR